MFFDHVVGANNNIILRVRAQIYLCVWVWKHLRLRASVSDHQFCYVRLWPSIFEHLKMKAKRFYDMLWYKISYLCLYICSIRKCHPKIVTWNIFWSQPTSSVSRRPIPTIWDHGGPPQSPQTTIHTPERTRFCSPLFFLLAVVLASQPTRHLRVRISLVPFDEVDHFELIHMFFIQNL